MDMELTTEARATLEFRKPLDSPAALHAGQAGTTGAGLYIIESCLQGPGRPVPEASRIGIKAGKIDFQFPEEIQFFSTLEISKLIILFKSFPGLEDQLEHGRMLGFRTEAVILTLEQIR
jgi:hypothetical protein